MDFLKGERIMISSLDVEDKKETNDMEIATTNMRPWEKMEKQESSTAKKEKQSGKEQILLPTKHLKNSGLSAKTTVIKQI